MNEAISCRNVTEANYCLATNSGSQSVPSNVETLVSMPIYDTNNIAMSATPGRVTVGVSGTYIVTALVRWSGGSDFASQMSVYKNGGAVNGKFMVNFLPAVVGNDKYQSISFIARLLPTDYFEIAVYQDNVASRTILEASLSVAKI